jgi:GNAT superfamily N-acetyltransferase
MSPMQEAIVTDMARLATNGSTLVAEAGGLIRGTGSLEGDRVKMMFVDPDWQRRGIGARLLRELLRIASENGQPGVMLFSSLNAEGFYARMGFTKVRDNVWENERTVVMKKRL